MKIVSLEKVELLIEEAKSNVSVLTNAKDNLIQKNAVAINELIQKKLKEISAKIKEESIREVCGDELLGIENDITKEIDKIELLNSLIFEEDVEENIDDADTEETTEENVTNDEEIKQQEV